MRRARETEIGLGVCKIMHLSRSLSRKWRDGGGTFGVFRVTSDDRAAHILMP